MNAIFGLAYSFLKTLYKSKFLYGSEFFNKLSKPRWGHSNPEIRQYYEAKHWEKGGRIKTNVPMNFLLIPAASGWTWGFMAHWKLREQFSWYRYVTMVLNPLARVAEDNGRIHNGLNLSENKTFRRIICTMIILLWYKHRKHYMEQKMKRTYIVE